MDAIIGNASDFAADGVLIYGKGEHIRGRPVVVHDHHRVQSRPSFALSLDRSRHDAADDVTLRKQIQDQHREHT